MGRCWAGASFDREAFLVLLFVCVIFVFVLLMAFGAFGGDGLQWLFNECVFSVFRWSVALFLCFCVVSHLLRFVFVVSALGKGVWFGLSGVGQ